MCGHVVMGYFIASNAVKLDLGNWVNQLLLSCAILWVYISGISSNKVEDFPKDL